MPNRDIRRTGWRGLIPRKPHQIGRRGAILLTMGILWLIIGLGSIFDPTPGTQDLLVNAVPSEIRVSLWVTSALIAIGHAFRPPGTSDAVGFLALYAMPAYRAAMYLADWVDLFVPWGGPGYDRGFVTGAFYIALVTAVAICAGWKEPSHVATQTRLSERNRKERGWT